MQVQYKTTNTYITIIVKLEKTQRENYIISSNDAYMKQHSLLLLAEETSSIMELDPVQIALNIPPSMKIDFANKDIRSF